jgi:peptidoglycan/xylan/chitin deacetylase (PgdA/CDA1 family)
MYVSPETFEIHLRALKKHFEIVDLADWVSRNSNGLPLPDRACAITFDDGWRDNYEYAFPILKRASIPVTVFLVADFVGTNYEFWPNRLARLLTSIGPQSDIARERSLALLERIGIDPRPSRNGYCKDFVDAAITAAKSVPDATILRWLDEIDACAHSGAIRRSLLDEYQVLDMCRSGLVRFGSHGLKHTRLMKGLALEVLKAEVADSKERLSDLTGQPVGLFCYPNGDYSTEAVTEVRNVYAAAVTTSPGWNQSSTDSHLMHRMAIHEDISFEVHSFLARVGALV